MTTSLNDLPAASSKVPRLRNNCRASASTPPSTSLPVAGSCPTCPLKKIRSPKRTAWENGPIGAASLSERMVSTFIWEAPSGSIGNDKDDVAADGALLDRLVRGDDVPQGKACPDAMLEFAVAKQRADLGDR